MPALRLSDDDIYFPNPAHFDTPDVVAYGGDLSTKRLLLAYSLGIFPWYNKDEPILWWSPDPRMVLRPDDLKFPKSMRPYFNQNKFKVSYNVDFQGVMNACMTNNRQGQEEGSWINDDMIEAYTDLNRLGYAHSVEVWEDGVMVGGLYGVAIGRVFFGESMFTKVPNASKFGFITLVNRLKTIGFWLIDCQQETRHLASLGAKPIPRADFLEIMKKNEKEPNFLMKDEHVLDQK